MSPSDQTHRSGPALASSPDTDGSLKRLVLASASPRRRELIGAFDRPVELRTPVGEESPRRSDEPPEDYALRLALTKAEEVAAQAPGSVVLGADTAVVLDNEVMGKPADEAEAADMLSRLRGRAHRVVTGVVALDSDSGRRVSVSRSTDVVMREYSDAEVAAYVASGSPLDKAGAYAVQDRSFHPAESVDGYYLNVVGLPLCEVASVLTRLGQHAAFKAGWTPPDECRDCDLRHGQEAGAS